MGRKFNLPNILVIFGCGILVGLINPLPLRTATGSAPSTMEFTPSTSSQSSKSLVLSKTSLGPLDLSKHTRISKEFLEKKFPGHFISQEYMQGDSPDFYYFTVTSKDGDLLFTIKSFLDSMMFDPQNPNPQIDLRIDILEVHSNKIIDSYGIRPGDKVIDILKRRGNDLDFGLGHIAMVYMGKENIFYNIRMPSQAYQIPGLFKEKNSHHIKQMAIQEDWIIMSISWPRPAWN